MERVQERVHEMEKQRERSGEPVRDYGDRTVQDLDREDAKVHREGADGERPGVETSKDSA